MGQGISAEAPDAVIVLASGGLDSTTLAYELKSQGHPLRMLSFDYGQRHRRELDCARGIAAELEAVHHVVDLRSVGSLLRGSALTDGASEVPDGHYTDESMRITVVPNRNALMLDVAVALAVVHNCRLVAFGAHGGDHTIYPDCRAEFVEAFTESTRLANEGFLRDQFRVVAPFLTLSKTDIVRRGTRLGVQFEQTWSCYRGGVVHCGRCGTCTERREAFQSAGIADPTRYEVG